MADLVFSIRCNPPKTTHQAGLRIMKRKDGSQFVGKFAKSKSKKVEQDLITLIQEYVPSKALEGPLLLSVKWVYPWRKAEPKKNKANGIMYCDTRPDCDNLSKMLQDIMGKLNFYNDDSQIAQLIFSKHWGDEPGIYVTLGEL